MPSTIPFTLQIVNGDPFTSGGNINITTGTTSNAVFTEFDKISLSNVVGGDTISIGGLVYQYDYLGSHDVRGDPLQPAAYIRIVGPLPSGATLTIGRTFAIDLSGQPGDPNYPNLQNGNTRGTVADLDTTPINFPGETCFAKGTMILTARGPKPVESLQVGELIETVDAGLQPTMWLSKSSLVFGGDNEKQMPVLIAALALGADAPAHDLIVSPQHKVLLIDADGAEVLAPAIGLVSRSGIRRMLGRKQVEYFHMLLPKHSIIYSEGLATESFYPGAMALKMLSTAQRHEIETVLPLLKADPDSYGPKARKSPSRRQAEQQQNNMHGLAHTTHALLDR